MICFCFALFFFAIISVRFYILCFRLKRLTNRLRVQKKKSDFFFRTKLMKKNIHFDRNKHITKIILCLLCIKLNDVSAQHEALHFISFFIIYHKVNKIKLHISREKKKRIGYDVLQCTSHLFIDGIQREKNKSNKNNHNNNEKIDKLPSNIGR